MQIPQKAKIQLGHMVLMNLLILMSTRMGFKASMIHSSFHLSSSIELTKFYSLLEREYDHHNLEN